jgi:simple sugar transport system ATP-binding protein
METVYQDLALAAEIDPAANMFLGREILRGGPLGKLGFLDKAEMRAAARRRSATSACRSRTRARPSPTCPAASARASRSRAPSRGRARSCSWTSRPRHSASSRRATVLEQIKRVREQGLAVVLISHNLPEIFEVADRIEVLRLGEAVARLRPSESRWRTWCRR